MARTIGYPESDIDEALRALETMSADVGSIINNMDDKERVMEMIKRLSSGIHKVHKLLDGEA